MLDVDIVVAESCILHPLLQLHPPILPLALGDYLADYSLERLREILIPRPEILRRRDYGECRGAQF